MNDRHSPTIGNILPFAILMGASGWGGIVFLMTQTKPTLNHRWLFFCAVVVAATGTASPVVGLINLLLSTKTPVSFGMIVRESLWVGIYFAALIWLNKGQVLTLSLAVVLAVGLIMVELLLRLRARSEWHPGKYSDD